MIRWLFLFLTLAACSPKIVQYANPKARYASFKSYVLLAGRSNSSLELKDTTSVGWRLERELKIEMARRSYELDFKEPDLILRYDVVSNNESRRSMNPAPFGYYSYYNTMNMQTFTESAVLLELLDRRTNKLVWQSSLDLQNLDKRKRKRDPVAAAVNQLFNTYLYKAGTSKPDPSLITK